eukprot:IDg5010t1
MAGDLWISWWIAVGSYVSWQASNFELKFWGVPPHVRLFGDLVALPVVRAFWVRALAVVSATVVSTLGPLAFACVGAGFPPFGAAGSFARCAPSQYERYGWRRCRGTSSVPAGAPSIEGGSGAAAASASGADSEGVFAL